MIFILKNKNLKLLIEFNGEQHYKPVNFDSKVKTKEDFFQENIKRDKIKQEYCLKNNIPLLEIPYTEIFNIENIIRLKLKEVEVI